MKTKILINNEISRDIERPGHISISQPEWNMTGEYTCLVQTFESADRKSAHLQIIGKSFVSVCRTLGFVE